MSASPRITAAGVTGLVAFARGDEGRPALLGFVGAVLLALGGLGAGSTRQHDPVLEATHLSWLRFGHGLVVSSLLLWIGVLVLLAAWIWLGRWLIEGRQVSEHALIATAGFWLAPLLVSVPLFSRDAYSYLAQGALLRDGFDPYVVGPIENPNILLDNVSSVWTTTTAPYGPAFILIAKFVTTLVGDNTIAGTILLRLCMLPGLALLIWAAPRVARHVGANGAVALWICVLNPLVIIHLVGGVHNEMLMVGLMMAGIASTLAGRHVAGAALIAVAVAVKATAVLALPFMVWVWVRHLGGNRLRAFAIASATALATFLAVFAVLSGLAGVGLGWLTALSGSARIINWLTVPTAVANVADAVVGNFVPVSFYGVLEVSRMIGAGVILVALPLLWWRFRHSDREALQGIAVAMVVVVLFVPAALPWYYTWPLAVLSALAQSRRALALIAGFSTWVMLIFKPDGSHGMYYWLHVLLATLSAVAAWYALSRSPRPVPGPAPAR
ncbi:MAG: alpha-(1-_6)-mannopyranosyltransferase A [Mycobacterium sp.]|nr:alpha-(1->6)-mannopyranosyltransferase A [Mycobacterium sp.]